MSQPEAPAVRLAYFQTGDRTLKELSSPTVRLAIANAASQRVENTFDKAKESPTVRLAHAPGAQGTNVLCGQRGVQQIERSRAPALLVSFVYLKHFLKGQNEYAYRDWALDSGAFSAHESGYEIDLMEYIETCKELLANDPTLTEMFSLDVIGDWKATNKNTEIMWKHGVPAIPCFHVGEPEDYLIAIARDYPKIALGGVALAKTGKKLAWAQQCFSRVWPAKIHGFGFGSQKAILDLPWHSTDATNWEIGPCKFGRWNSFGGEMSVRGSKHNLRAEIEYYLDVEAKARRRWQKEMQLLDRIAAGEANREDMIRKQPVASEEPEQDSTKDDAQEIVASEPIAEPVGTCASEGSKDDTMQGIRIACCVPRQYHTRKEKLDWLYRAIKDNPCDLFLAPQEYFGGHVAMPDDLHVEEDWLKAKMSLMANELGTAIGVGAAVKHASGGATEDYLYFDRHGNYCGYHRKFALPAYDDVRANGAGQLWPETNYQARAKLVEIPDLDLKIGTVFCWEVFSLTLWAAYSFAGANLIAHPIKFAPRGWPKLSPAKEGVRRVIAFGNEPKSQLWRDRLILANAHEVFCPIAISCNTWDLGGSFAAMTGHVDEILGTTNVIDVPSDPASEHVHVFKCDPLFYSGIDHSHSAGSFKAFVGTVDNYSKLGPWTMHKKMRRIEAQLIGGTTKLDCILKASTLGRQKKSVQQRAAKLGRK